MTEETPVELKEDAAPKEPEKAPAPDYYNQILLLKAEFDNFRKRTDREKPEYFKLGKAEVLVKLLPIYDLLQHAHAEVLASHVDTPLAKGMEGIFKEFEKIFKEEGVAAMAPVGLAYDALKHEVIGMVDKPDMAEGAVVDVLQTGFMLNDKVLRTAKVRIAKKTELKDTGKEAL